MGQLGFAAGSAGLLFPKQRVVGSTHLGQRPHSRGPTLPHLVRHAGTCQINAQLVDETRLIRTVDQGVGLPNPQLVHSVPVADDYGALISQDTLED